MSEQGGMSGGRRLVVSGFIACTMGLQFLEVARQGEHWPYAQYAMYASEHGGDITWYRVYGVTPEGEFPLDRDEYFPPFDPQRLSFSFAPRPPRRDLVIPPRPTSCAWSAACTSGRGSPGGTTDLR